MPSLKDVIGRLRLRTLKQPRSRDELHEYWRAPDQDNAAADYREGAERSAYLVDLMDRHVSRDGAVLEIGCNVGRNLHHLREAGYKNLSGVEISQEAVDLMKETFPDVAANAQIHVGPVEEQVKTFADGQFEAVYTMAVLEHIHTDSDWVFDEMARIASRRIIVLEDEKSRTWRHFQRNYREVFEKAGGRQLEEADLTDVPGLGSKFVARVFDVE